MANCTTVKCWQQGSLAQGVTPAGSGGAVTSAVGVGAVGHERAGSPQVSEAEVLMVMGACLGAAVTCFVLAAGMQLTAWGLWKLNKRIERMDRKPPGVINNTPGDEIGELEARMTAHSQAQGQLKEVLGRMVPVDRRAVARDEAARGTGAAE